PISGLDSRAYDARGVILFKAPDAEAELRDGVAVIKRQGRDVCHGWSLLSIVPLTTEWRRSSLKLSQLPKWESRPWSAASTQASVEASPAPSKLSISNDLACCAWVFFGQTVDASRKGGKKIRPVRSYADQKEWD